MQIEEKILRRMKELFKAPVQIIPGTVTKVDEATLTIDVEPPEGAEILEVRLKAGVDSITDGVVEIPEVGSFVLIAMIGNAPEEYCVIKTSKVTKTQFNGGQLGGLIVIQTLIDELSKNNEILQALLNVLTGTPINEPGNGAPSALQAALSSVLGGKAVGDFSTMEDNKVLH